MQLSIIVVLLDRKAAKGNERQPLQLNIQWLPNPTKQFISPSPNMPLSTPK